MSEESKSKRLINIIILLGFGVLFITFMTITAFVNQSNKEKEKIKTKCIDNIQYAEKNYNGNTYYKVLFEHSKTGKKLKPCSK